jgi:transcription-repair coupling factor (superfamily II helicase)
VRLDLFGDVLDGARRFDPATQRTTEKLERVELAPVSEVILDEAAITRFRQNYRIEFGAAGTDDPLYEAVSAGRKHQGWSTGCRSSTNGWRRCSTTCPAPRSRSTTR